MVGNVDTECRSDVVEIMRKICDIVEREQLADGHITLTKLLKEK